MNVINVYCDESRHLEADSSSTMVLGAVWIDADKVAEVTHRVREIKMKHNVSSYLELKWTSISPSKLQMYLDIVDYFFDADDLHFRGVLASKNGLNHEKMCQSHDDWYYKMMFVLLKVILNPKQKLHIYLDLKDTHSAQKIIRLKTCLNRTAYEFDENLVARIQPIRSHESAILQLTDLFAGALAFSRSAIQESSAKKKVIERIKERSGKALKKNSLYSEPKLNLFNWSPREVEE